ncbi:MAG: hypothetical protein HGB17_08765 [Syntrophobacteraceae bacterium]|nr:hypothetical protein [Syntrophobacteraceae bacterium]
MEPVRTPTKAQACPSCGRPVGRDREVGHCDSCALDQALFVPESRWPSLRELSDRV